MESRIVKIIKSRSGGTAMGSAVSYKLSLPTVWVREMGIEDNLSAEISFDGEKIILRRLLNPKDFAYNAAIQGHEVKVLKYYDGTRLNAIIYADYSEKRVMVEMLSSAPIDLPFGTNINPGWSDYEHFLSERCISRDRLGIREYLETIGVAKYDCLEIIKKTEGRMAEDNCRLTVEEYEENSACY